VRNFVNRVLDIMKEYLKKLKNKIRGMDADTKYTSVGYLFIFLFVSTMGVLAASGWRIHVAPSTYVPLTILQNIESDEVGVAKETSAKKEIIQRDLIQESSASTTRVSQSGESEISISEADKAKTDDLKEQLRLAEEMEKQTKEGLANLKKTLSEQTVTPPPTLKPLPTTKAPEPIIVKPLPSQPTEVCRAWTETPYGKVCSRTEIIFK
jgi:hypothetical protein